MVLVVLELQQDAQGQRVRNFLNKLKLRQYLVKALVTYPRSPCAASSSSNVTVTEEEKKPNLIYDKYFLHKQRN